MRSRMHSHASGVQGGWNCSPASNKLCKSPHNASSTPTKKQNHLSQGDCDYFLIQQKKGWRADFPMCIPKLPWKTTGLVRVYSTIQSPRICSLICTGASWASWRWPWQFWTRTKRYCMAFNMVRRVRQGLKMLKLLKMTVQGDEGSSHSKCCGKQFIPYPNLIIVFRNVVGVKVARYCPRYCKYAGKPAVHHGPRGRPALL